MEYQYYEFRAVDEPLDEAAQRALRKLTTRAEITERSLVNTYNFGDFRGNPAVLVDKYFDAHVYVANWGARRLSFRFPKGTIDARAVGRYCDGNILSLRRTGRFVVLDLNIEDEESNDEDWEGSEWLQPLLGLREELMAGDLRALYLAWLLVVELGEIDATDPEPPVPAGLGALTAAQRSLVEFLRLDGHLVEAAAKRSPKKPEPTRREVASFVEALPAREKNQVLARIVAGDEVAVREIRKRFAGARVVAPAEPRRSVAGLVAEAEALRSPRRRAKARK